MIETHSGRCIFELCILINVLIFVFSVLFDRGFSEWDDQLANIDLDNFENASDHSCDYLHHIRQTGM